MPPMFSKALESALAAMSYLAETYDGGATTQTAVQIAAARALHRPVLAKLLTSLAQSGLVTGKPGRNGGFTLARPPGEIALIHIADAVGHRARIRCCPFGPEYGEDKGTPCALHDQVAGLRDQERAFLEKSTLGAFTARP